MGFFVFEPQRTQRTQSGTARYSSSEDMCFELQKGGNTLSLARHGEYEYSSYPPSVPSVVSRSPRSPLYAYFAHEAHAVQGYQEGGAGVGEYGHP